VGDHVGIPGVGPFFCLFKIMRAGAHLKIMLIINRLLTVSINRETKHTNVTCDNPYHFMTMAFARNTMVASK
jgi:hypothetical protein